jgi:uncharacterized protein (UPF0276 family)
MWRRWLRRLRRVNSRDLVGLGWRTPLAASTFAHLDAIDVVEVIADDYFEASARVLRSMKSLAREVPVVLHGVALGLASVVPVASKRVDRVAKVIDVLEPAQWSEHLAFVRGGPYEIGHLAAPPRCPATVAGAVDNLARIRAVVGESPAVENIATLIDPPGSCLSEPEWVSAIAVEGGSPLLLDLHNLFANAVNFGGQDPLEYLLRFPLERVRQVHISGGRWIELNSREHGIAARRLLDDHVHDVPDVVFELLVELARRCPQPLTVILERDGHYPEFSSLLGQVQRAREALALGRSQRVELSGGDWGAQVEARFLRAAEPTRTCGASASKGSARMESFLARLYCDRPFLNAFMAAPDTITRQAGLDPAEQQAVLAIDRAGLLMAARSFESKRRQRWGDDSPRRSARAWRRVFPFMEKFRPGRPPVDPHF